MIINHYYRVYLHIRNHLNYVSLKQKNKCKKISSAIGQNKPKLETLRKFANYMLTWIPAIDLTHTGYRVFFSCLNSIKFDLVELKYKIREN